MDKDERARCAHAAMWHFRALSGCPVGSTLDELMAGLRQHARTLGIDDDLFDKIAVESRDG